LCGLSAQNAASHFTSATQARPFTGASDQRARVLVVGSDMGSPTWGQISNFSGEDDGTKFEI
jgi:hypothetical protein